MTRIVTTTTPNASVTRCPIFKSASLIVDPCRC